MTSGERRSEETQPGADDATSEGPEAAPRAPGSSASRFPVIGIGASAGGLAAIEAFLSAMPARGSTGAAFVLVQHLAPDHRSMLTELLRRYTTMEVFEVTDGMVVERDCAYVIPPNRDLALADGVLRLTKPDTARGLRLPIDHFFASLADDQHERAICIVLSGTGSDGVLGLRAIKAAGGMVMAQEPTTTEHDGMPRSAIATGLVDYVLPPAEMPGHLLAYMAHAYRAAPPQVATKPALPADAGRSIFALLRAVTGHDFSQYKQNTIARRIDRRMAVHQIEHLDEYVRYLEARPDEVNALFRDLLIGVTSFFRDADVFDVLAKHAIPRAFAGRAPGSVIRAWVPGCSTGEEAYSIAILLQEHVDTLGQSFQLQVFATDIDGAAIDRARAGVYPASIAADITPERLARFFSRRSQGGDYRVHKSIRDLLVFSEQDVIKDPPFSRLDLISCRNLLIYLDADLQKRLIPLFHYALNPGGLLLLGTSETIGDHAELFTSLDRASKLYLRREHTAAARGPLLRRLTVPRAGPSLRSPEKAPTDAKVRFREVTERALLRHHAPVGALVDERGEILYLHGRTGQYLEPAPGDAGINILKMAREGLLRDLTRALSQAAMRKEPETAAALRVRTNGGFSSVDLTVRPVTVGLGEGAPTTLFLVTFAPTAAHVADREGEASAPESRPERADANTRIASLLDELRAKEDYLQCANEELEVSNEELRSANEELQSVNEELQSTNEEMETSKEELQSVNEELATVNAELQQKVTDLSRANNDMNNLLAGTGIGTVFVDSNLRIQRFTPAVTQVINLIPSDVGRPVDHISGNLRDYDRLVDDVRAVLETLVPTEVEVRSRAGAWYSLRIRPYRTTENVIGGAVITFVEITELMRAREVLREGEATKRLAAIVRDAHDAITVQDLEGRILAWNPGAERLFGWSEAEALAMNIRDIVPAGSAGEALAHLRRLSSSERFGPFQTRRVAKGGRIVDVWLTATALEAPDGTVYAVSTTECEVGERRQ